MTDYKGTLYDAVIQQSGETSVHGGGDGSDGGQVGSPFHKVRFGKEQDCRERNLSCVSPWVVSTGETGESVTHKGNGPIKVKTGRGGMQRDLQQVSLRERKVVVVGSGRLQWVGKCPHIGM